MVCFSCDEDHMKTQAAYGNSVNQTTNDNTQTNKVIDGIARFPPDTPADLPARHIVLGRTRQISAKNWVAVSTYSSMWSFMYELCHGKFDIGICGSACEIGEVYWNPSVDLRYPSDDEEPVTAFFECNGSSRGHHDVVAVRQVT